MYQELTVLKLNHYLAKVLSTLALGLGISGFSAFLLTNYFVSILNIPFMWVISGILQISLVLIISLAVRKLSKFLTWFTFISYTFISGFNIATILLSFEITTIFTAFLITAIVFLSMAYIGYSTKFDLTKYSSYLMFGLVSLIILTLVNILIIKSSGLDLMMLYFGTLLFLGFVAYDIQYIRKLYYEALNDEKMKEKLIILGALILYLDFINLFIRVLKIVADNK